jgi:hypothetical protein
MQNARQTYSSGLPNGIHIFILKNKHFEYILEGLGMAIWYILEGLGMAIWYILESLGMAIWYI